MLLQRNLFYPFLLCAIAPVCVYFWLYSDLFPLIEYRQWVESPDAATALTTFLYNAALPTASFSRSFSLLFVNAVGASCDTAVRCHNWAQLALIGGTALGMFLLACHFTRQRSYLTPALASIAFLLSIPTIDAVVWQATVLDKMAAFLTIWTLYLWVRLVDAQQSKLLVNVLMGLAVILASNSKEAAWALLPSLYILGFLTILRSSKGSLLDRLSNSAKQTIGLLLLPTLYFIYFIAAYFWNFFKLGYVEHAMSGNRVENLNLFIGMLTNMRMKSSWAFPAFSCLALALAGTFHATNQTKEQARYSDIFTWSFISFLIAITIPSGTKYHSPFYLLVPAIFFYLSIFAAAARINEAISPKFSIILGCILIALTSNHAILFYNNADHYFKVYELSRNARRLLRQVAQDSSSIKLVYPTTQWRAYMFFEPTHVSRALDRFGGPPSQNVTTVASSAPINEPPAPTGRTYWLDNNLAVIRSEVRP